MKGLICFFALIFLLNLSYSLKIKNDPENINNINNDNITSNEKNKIAKDKYKEKEKEVISPIYGISENKNDIIPGIFDKNNNDKKEISNENNSFVLSPNSESGSGSDSKDVFLSCLIKHCIKCEEKQAYSCVECDNGFDLHEKKCYSNLFFKNEN